MTTTMEHPVRKGHRASATLHGIRQIPVSIGIGRDTHGKPTELFINWGAHAEPKIWWAHRGHPLKIWHADSVVWVTTDLRSGETIHIEPVSSPAQHKFFTATSFDLDHIQTTAVTGPVQSMANHKGKVQLWIYNVVLSSPALTSRLTLDPVIIIEEEH